MSRKLIRILFLIFFLSSSIAFPQVSKNKVLLSSLLDTLQKKHKRNFTYADKVIKDIYIKKPSEKFSFNEVINYLRNETGLIFQILEYNFVTIKPKIESIFICGYIIDYETKLPVESATINGQNRYTITDEFGYFKLKVPQENKTISIQHLGYQSLSKPTQFFSQEDCINMYIIPQIESLSEVVLTNFIAKGIDKLADGTFQINFSNLGILPGLIETDVLQTIQALPGIQSTDETISNITIRGGTNDQNLLLWDGIKMYQSGHFFGLISIFNPLITNEVTVLKNGTNVNLSSGVSGTNAMKTASDINTSLKGSIGLNFIDTNGHVDLPLGKKSSLQISVRKAINEFVKTPTYTNYFDRILRDTEIESNTEMNSDISFDFYDTSLRWLYTISDKDQLRINFLNVNNELMFTESAIVNQSKQSRISNLIQNSTSEGIFYKRKWNTRFVTTLQIYETDYRLKAINSEIAQQQRLLQENKVSETSIQLSSWYKLNTNFSFLNGYQFIETGISNLTDVDNPVYREFITEVLREHALYSQLNYISNSQKTNIKAGIRYSYIEKFNKHLIEPRFSLNHKFLDWFSLEFSGELKHQNTSQIINLQNDFLGIEKRRWQLSNNIDIPIITSQQISIGLNFKHKGWLINAEGYIKEVEGITTQSQGFINQYAFSKEIGSYRVDGIDFLVNKRLKKWNTWLSYSYATNKYTFENLKEINFPNNLDITHTLGLGISFSANSFKISTGLNWHTGKPTTTPIIGNEITGTTINYELANNRRLKDYFRIDASATYRFKISPKVRAIAGASIWNGINYKNIINNYYQITPDNTTKKITKKALNFTPNASFRLQF